MNKICTSVEQSKKLIELGIDIDTADLVVRMLPITDGTEFAFVRNKNRWDTFPSITDGKVENVPAWSLAALLDVLPKIHGLKPVLDLEENSIQYSGIDIYIVADNPVDACYEMIIKLHELKML